MSRVLRISEDRYSLLEQLAKERHQSVEEYLAALLDAAWEEECAKYDAAFENSPDWLEGAREALEEVRAGNTTFFPSTEAFFRHLGASEEELEAARKLDQEDDDADA